MDSICLSFINELIHQTIVFIFYIIKKDKKNGISTRFLAIKYILIFPRDYIQKLKINIFHS